METRNSIRPLGPVVIDIENITKDYVMGEEVVRALRGVTLQIHRNEYIAIMGPSGSGKSTLMNMLGCLDTPSSGRYEFNSKNVAEMDDDELAAVRNREIGFVFQTFNLLPRATSLRNVELPLIYAGIEPERREARATQVLADVGLGDRIHHKPNELSGGQQQRVAIARALINGPSVILADEPTGNLDSRTSDEIMDVLRSLNREQGVTIVVVTHNPAIAAATDRIVTMRDGRFVSDEPVAGNVARTTRPGAAAVASALAGSAPGRLGASWAFALMILSAAAQAITRNTLRSVLTVLGIFIGVAALIAMVAVGQGANAAVEKQIENLG